MAYSLLLLRHGQILANKEGRWHGSTDSPLLPLGERQARRAGLELARREQIGGWKLAAVYCSPLERCRHTAALALQGRRAAAEPLAARLLDRWKLRTLAPEPRGLAAKTKSDLREYGIGEWEDLPFSELAEKHQFIGRAAEDHSFAPPGGESLGAVSSRLSRVLQELDQAHGPKERVLVVGHGAAFAIAIATLLNANASMWMEYPLSNCSLTELRLGAMPELLSYNSTSHL